MDVFANAPAEGPCQREVWQARVQSVGVRGLTV
jgi:hypothetical protein